MVGATVNIFQRVAKAVQRAVQTVQDSVYQAIPRRFRRGGETPVSIPEPTRFPEPGYGSEPTPVVDAFYDNLDKFAPAVLREMLERPEGLPDYVVEKLRELADLGEPGERMANPDDNEYVRKPFGSLADALIYSSEVPLPTGIFIDGDGNYRVIIRYDILERDEELDVVNAN